MNRQDKNKMKLAGLLAHITDNPNKDKGIQARVMYAIEDAIVEGLTDKQYSDYYTHARRIATRYGYSEYLTQGRIPEGNPVLADAFKYIADAIEGAIAHESDTVFNVLRRKKNKAGLVRHNRASFVKSLIESCQRWHTNAYNTGQWDGTVETMLHLGLPTETTKEDV